MLRYIPTPVQEIQDPILDEANVRLLIKREDLNHPFVSGNKWWKLKYNLAQAKKENKKTLLTFGGAYSNHIYATAAAANELGFESIGIIRGEETLPLNHTLSFATGRGMRIRYVSREEYQIKNNPTFIQKLQDQFGDFYLLPEGGTNDLAIKGCEEFAKILGDNFNFLCCPVGTGGTLAGIINQLPRDKTILGFSSLKGGDFLQSSIEDLVRKPSASDWKIITDYHFGGYGKTTSQVEVFRNDFEKNNNIPLDPVYTAKMMAGIFDLVQKGFFKKGSTILTLHTGGLQGKALS